jgi:methyl-accepting chemotaxis protein
MLSLINDIFVFTFPSKYPQFYTMIYGFEFLLIIIAKDLIVEIISIYKDVLSKNSSLTFKNKELNLYIEKIETIRTYLINNHDIYKKISLVIKDLSNNLSSTVSQFTAHIEEIVTTNNYIYENEGEAIKNIDNQLRLIDDIREKLNDFINLFNEIDQNIKNVKDFAENIENISKQTNLLGLNASIEASRGGDFSKEFTVVANEVKNLASKSTALSNSINENVKKLLDYMVKGSINSKTLNKNFEDLNYSFNQFYNIIKKNRELSDILFEKFNTISNLINDFSDISSLLASESENLIL